MFWPVIIVLWTTFPDKYTYRILTLRQALFGAMIMFPFVWLWDYYFSKSSPGNDKTAICNKCFNVKARNRRVDCELCECGGEFEPLIYWEWVDDDE